MSADDPRDTSDDVAGELVAGLEQGAELVERGAFELDLAQAQGKLAAFAMPDPNRFVLLLVEAAHLLPGCTGLSLVISRRGTKASFEGASLDADELRGCFELPLGSRRQRSTVDARRQRARQRLGLALLAALGIAGGPIEIRSTTEAGTLRFVLELGGGTQLDGTAETSPEPRLSIMVPAELVPWVRGRPRRQRALLRELAFTSTVPLWLDGTRIDRGLELSDLVEGVEILDEGGEPIGRAGWSAEQFDRQCGSIIVVANGVVVETAVERGLIRGFLAIVDASELPRDLSLSKLRRGAAYDSLVERAVAAQSILARPVPISAPSIGGSQSNDILVGTLAGASFGVGGLFTGLAALFTNPWPTAVFGVPLVLIGLAAGGFAHSRISRGLRKRRARRRGRPTVGVIQTVSTRATDAYGVFEHTLEVRVEPEGAPAYVAQIVMSSGQNPNLGERLFLRVDPSDPSVVALTGR